MTWLEAKTNIDRHAWQYAQKFAAIAPVDHLDITDPYTYELYTSITDPYEQDVVIINPNGAATLKAYSTGEDSGGYVRIDTYAGYEQIRTGETLTRRLSNGVVINVYGW